MKYIVRRYVPSVKPSGASSQIGERRLPLTAARPEAKLAGESTADRGRVGGDRTRPLGASVRGVARVAGPLSARRRRPRARGAPGLDRAGAPRPAGAEPRGLRCLPTRAPAPG